MKKKQRIYNTDEILHNLREEYERQLSQPVEEVKSKDTITVITFKLGDEWYGLETKYATEIRAVPIIIEVPCTPDFILGVINLRGIIIAIIDIRNFFDIPSQKVTSESHIILFQINEINIGLLVDNVQEIIEFPKTNIKPPIATLSGIKTKFIHGQCHINNDLLIIIDLEKLMNIPDMEINYKKQL